MSFRKEPNPFELRRQIHSSLRTQTREEFLQRKRILVEEEMIDSNREITLKDLPFIKKGIESNDNFIILQSLVQLKKLIIINHSFNEIINSSIIDFLISFVTSNDVCIRSLTITLLAQIASTNDLVLVDKLIEKGVMICFSSILEKPYQLKFSNLFQSAAIGFGNIILSGDKYRQCIDLEQFLPKFLNNCQILLESSHELQILSSFAHVLIHIQPETYLLKIEIVKQIVLVLLNFSSIIELDNYKELLFSLYKFISYGKEITQMIWESPNTIILCKMLLKKKYDNSQSIILNLIINSFQQIPQLINNFIDLLSLTIESLPFTNVTTIPLKLSFIIYFIENINTQQSVLSILLSRQKALSLIVNELQNILIDNVISSIQILHSLITTFIENQQLITTINDYKIVSLLIQCTSRKGISSNLECLEQILDILITFCFYQKNIPINEDYEFYPIEEFDENGGQVLIEQLEINCPDLQNKIQKLKEVSRRISMSDDI
ncbi:hypothetical protein KM1_126320 [Entamoeba histolytica HM-3:IMSS]|uniref:Uncharacterized protein n=2 Tax=Entamoeba histolytica TaxID=5759 RepID=M2S9C7_ENTHI|nr:Hypothetical protein EHI5A_108790 [Entamoeba histolytica KU27]EMS13508.1 hypothetical protein KM1_126320 [Entamoeba histolytica HM-3:IMSS]